MDWIVPSVLNICYKLLIMVVALSGQQPISGHLLQPQNALALRFGPTSFSSVASGAPRLLFHPQPLHDFNPPSWPPVKHPWSPPPPPPPLVVHHHHHHHRVVLESKKKRPVFMDKVPVNRPSTTSTTTTTTTSTTTSTSTARPRETSTTATPAVSTRKQQQQQVDEAEEDESSGPWSEEDSWEQDKINKGNNNQSSWHSDEQPDDFYPFRFANVHLGYKKK
ncbi:serine proteinase stubble-like [Cloeon dipterum]|uniref:serine proteinase stubble-like n=1 Tax=Cloeon dipterum TaxID=197152 RepID=UPI0032202433